MASERAVVGSGQSPGYVAEKIGELSLLFDISQTLDSSMDLRDTLGPVLEIIAKYKGVIRGSLTLLNRETGEISIEAAYGLSPSQQRRGRYRVGEGIIGQVFQTGKPAIIPKVQPSTKEKPTAPTPTIRDTEVPWSIRLNMSLPM